MKTQNHNCSAELQQVQLKVTPARIATMQLFESHDTPIDAQHLIDHLQKNLGIDRVTGFRILNTFVEKGLVTKFEFREGKARYELSSRGDHHHLICTLCGDISDIRDNAIVHDYIEKVERKYSFKASEHALELFGTCKKCQAN